MTGSHRNASYSLLVFLAFICIASDWPEVRGPNRDGLSAETNLPERWSPEGENLVWQAPYGGLSGPVVLGDRIYLQNMVGEGAELQERIVSLDANTGKLVWEKRISVNHSLVPPERAAGATPALDPQLGHVYVLTTAGMLAAYTRAGVPLWTRDLYEEFGFVLTDSGRMASPVVDGPLVIVSGITFGWGELVAGAQRFLAFDKRTGDSAWVSSSEKRPYEPISSPPLITEVDGVRLLVAGGSDGAWHAIKVSTGEPVWRYEVSKRGVNTGAIRAGQDLILTHGVQNLETTAMGFMAALNPAVTGEVSDKQTRWLTHGFLAGASSPVSDGKRFYLVNDNDNSLDGFDTATGKQLWSLDLGQVQKAAPVLADGKIYIGTENGRFFILRPGADGCEILSENRLGTTARPEPVTAGAAVSNGRIYFSTSKTLYAIGRAGSRAPTWTPSTAAVTTNIENRVPTYLQIIPADVAVYPGGTVKFRVRLFDAKGNFIREETPQPLQQQSSPGQSQQQGNPQQNAQQPKSDLQWSLEGLAGSVQPDGTYNVASEPQASFGKVKVKLGTLTGEARMRVLPQRWEMTFDDLEAGSFPEWWVNARDKFAVKVIDGNKVLAKLANTGAHAFAGPHTATNYTVEADVRFPAETREANGGVAVQGYELILYLSGQRIALQSWQPEENRTRTANISVNTSTWYRIKLRVEPLLDGSVRARGKAWVAAEPEPAAWMVDRTDPSGLGLLIGSPGFSSTAPSEVYFDNIKVTPN